MLFERYLTKEVFQLWEKVNKTSPIHVYDDLNGEIEMSEILNNLFENRYMYLPLISISGDDIIAHTLQVMAEKASDSQAELWFSSLQEKDHTEGELRFQVDLDQVLTKKGKNVLKRLASYSINSLSSSNSVLDHISQEVNESIRDVVVKTVSEDITETE